MAEIVPTKSLLDAAVSIGFANSAPDHAMPLVLVFMRLTGERPDTFTVGYYPERADEERYYAVVSMLGMTSPNPYHAFRCHGEQWEVADWLIQCEKYLSGLHGSDE